MSRIVRLTESDLTRLVKRVIRESKKIASFDDEMGWYDENDLPVKPEDFGDDYEEEEYDEFEPMHAKHGKDTKWFPDSLEGMSSIGLTGKEMFNKYREGFGKPFRIRTRRSMDESEKEKEELSDEEVNKLVDYFWDSMSTGEKRRFMTKIEKERKEKGLPSLRPKSSRIMKKDK